jgi:L-fuculose-phosphate aldolase
MKDLREDLAAYGRLIVEQNLVTAGGGNISACRDGKMLISPSGLSLGDVTPEQFVEIDVRSGEIAAGALRPSSELLMHLICYRRRPDIRALIHTHAQFTIALTSAGRDLEPMTADAVVYLGRRIPHLDYITVTTPELADAVGALIGEANCIILRNHGAITVGENLKEAFWRAGMVEESAHIQTFATLLGVPRFLTAEEAVRLEALGSEKYRRELLARAKA